MKRRHIMILLVIFAIGGYSLQAFTAALNPYLSLAAAKAATGVVQVKGKLVKTAGSIRTEGQTLFFQLTDENGNCLEVAYPGEAPENFSHAGDVVAIGRMSAGFFKAEKLLIKCPSKYEKEGDGK